jgi:hypothetical protein
LETCATVGYPKLRAVKPERWFSIVFQHWDTSYFATILETASQCGGELQAAITQTGDVIWSMHKKKNSASVLAGEMILIFYKPANPGKKREAAKRSDDSTSVLSEVFDACLESGASHFTSEALFNRLVLELWHRHALGCLDLDRKEFDRQLEQRGWNDSSQNHSWSKAAPPEKLLGELMGFQSEKD